MSTNATRTCAHNAAARVGTSLHALRDAMNGATRVESTAILALIERAGQLKRDIEVLASDMDGDANHPAKE